MRNGKPLVYDGYCGLGGWAEGFLAEGWEVVGFDIERHDYGTGGYPGELILRDMTTIHGSELADADCLVFSPPCQRYSYMAMPWSRAKAQAAMIEADTTGEELRKLNLLFDTCFRLQREASEAAGHHISMIVENVRGAQKWVGRAAYHYGSFYLWGDVPALMPIVQSRKMKTTGPVDAEQTENHNCHINEMRDHMKNPGGGSWDRSRPSHTDDHSWDSGQKRNPDGTAHPPGSWFKIADSKNRGAKTIGHANIRDVHTHTRHLTNQVESDAVKVGGIDFSKGSAVGFNVTAAHREGTKQAGISGPRENGNGDKWFQDGAAAHRSRSNSRKAASALIAKIPYPLASHIAKAFKPE